MTDRTKTQAKRYITAQEGAAYLSISLRTLRTLLAKREIPYIQPSGKGGLVRLDVQDLDCFMAKNKVHCLDNARF
jgi:excisionase family DNA binding protein